MGGEEGGGEAEAFGQRSEGEARNWRRRNLDVGEQAEESNFGKICYFRVRDFFPVNSVIFGGKEFLEFFFYFFSKFCYF